MSYIPASKMPHAHAHDAPERTGGGELGGVPDKLVPRTSALGWILGAAGVGLAVATVAGLLSLRSSSSRKPARKRPARPRKSASAARKPRAKKAD